MAEGSGQIAVVIGRRREEEGGRGRGRQGPPTKDILINDEMDPVLCNSIKGLMSLL